MTSATFFSASMPTGDTVCYGGKNQRFLDAVRELSLSLIPSGTMVVPTRALTAAVIVIMTYLTYTRSSYFSTLSYIWLSLKCLRTMGVYLNDQMEYSSMIRMWDIRSFVLESSIQVAYVSWFSRPPKHVWIRVGEDIGDVNPAVSTPRPSRRTQIKS